LAVSGGSLLARIRRIGECEPARHASVTLILVAVLGAELSAGSARAEGSDDASTPPRSSDRQTIALDGKRPAVPFVAWSESKDFESNEPHDPLVVNGMVVVGTDKGELRAYRCKDGQTVWTHWHGSRVFHRPCSDGERIYLASDVGLSAVTAKDGQSLWSFAYCDGPACVLAKKKTVYFGGADGNLYAVDAETGKERWRREFLTDAPPDPPGFPGERARGGGNSAKARPSALISDDETLFLSVMDQCRVIAINATTGKRLWSFQARGWIFGAAAATEKHVFFGSQDNFFYCVDKATGKELWKHKTKSRIEAGGLIDDNSVIFCSCDGSVYCLNQSDGKVRWRFAADLQENGRKSAIYSVPVIHAGAVCFAAGEGQAYALDRNKGTLIWKIRPSAESELFCSPVTDGSFLFVTTRSRDKGHGEPSLVAIGLRVPTANAR
jgi:outer membrane protein assembly factor BamB